MSNPLRTDRRSFQSQRSSHHAPQRPPPPSNLLLEQPLSPLPLLPPLPTRVPPTRVPPTRIPPRHVPPTHLPPTRLPPFTRSSPFTRAPHPSPSAYLHPNRTLSTHRLPKRKDVEDVEDVEDVAQRATSMRRLQERPEVYLEGIKDPNALNFENLKKFSGQPKKGMKRDRLP